jgi:hypothetical protein
MDNQNQQPVSNGPQPIRQVETTITTVHEPATPNSAHNKPKLNISDEQAQAILAINNLQRSPTQAKNTKMPISLIITLIAVVAIAIVASILVGNIKPKVHAKTSPSSTTSNSSSSGTTNDSTTNQINQDVGSCSNPLTAISQC